MGQPAVKIARRRATYADLEAVPVGKVAELIGGALDRASRHFSQRKRGRTQPGGWRGPCMVRARGLPWRMPSITHQALVELFRGSPGLAPQLIASLLSIAMPAYTDAKVTEAALDQLVPTEFRADLVIELVDGGSAAICGAIVLEVQTGQDGDKPWAWPVYVTALRARHRIPVWLLVVTPSAHVASWAAQPVVFAPGTGAWSALVLGPGTVPAVASRLTSTTEAPTPNPAPASGAGLLD